MQVTVLSMIVHTILTDTACVWGHAGSKHGPMKPLTSTNGGSSGHKHKTAISMAIADIMVPKQVRVCFVSFALKQGNNKC